MFAKKRPNYAIHEDYERLHTATQKAILGAKILLNSGAVYNEQQIAANKHIYQAAADILFSEGFIYPAHRHLGRLAVITLSLRVHCIG